MARARTVPGLRPDTPYAEAAARVLAVRAQEVFDHADGVLDTSDIERVHDMRVATRRLRAVLEIFGPALPRRDAAQALKDVKRLADALGARRDPDVHVEALERVAAGLGQPDRPGVRSLVAEIRAEQAEGNELLAAELQRARDTGLRERLVALAASAAPADVEPAG
jgi:CHAD domain-containing protein